MNNQRQYILKETAPNKPDSPEDEVVIQGMALNNTKTQKFGKAQSPNDIRAQLVLRGIPRTETGFLKQKELSNLIKDLVKENKYVK